MVEDGPDQVEVRQLSVGPWDPHADFVGRDILAIVVASGILLREVHIGDIVSSQFLGPGDLVAHRGALDGHLPVRVRWTAAADTRLVVVDSAYANHAPGWGALAARLLRTAGEQQRRSSLQQAIGHLARVEDRIAALLWHLAERWGRVAVDGVVVPLDLTHELIGRLVGARRPTVSLALKQLADEGVVVKRGDGQWLLRHGSAATFAPINGGLRMRRPVPALLASAAHDRTLAVEDSQSAMRRRVAMAHASAAENQRRTAMTLARCRATREELAGGRVSRRPGP